MLNRRNSSRLQTPPKTKPASSEESAPPAPSKKRKAPVSTAPASTLLPSKKMKTTSQPIERMKHTFDYPFSESESENEFGIMFRSPKTAPTQTKTKLEELREKKKEADANLRQAFVERRRCLNHLQDLAAEKVTDKDLEHWNKFVGRQISVDKMLQKVKDPKRYGFEMVHLGNLDIADNEKAYSFFTRSGEYKGQKSVTTIVVEDHTSIWAHWENSDTILEREDPELFEDSVDSGRKLCEKIIEHFARFAAIIEKSYDEFGSN